MTLEYRISNIQDFGRIQYTFYKFSTVELQYNVLAPSAAKRLVYWSWPLFLDHYDHYFLTNRQQQKGRYIGFGRYFWRTVNWSSTVVGFFLCTFTTTTGSDNFRKPEFFPSRTWVFFGRTWVFSWMDLSFPQINKKFCQIWPKTPCPGRFWVVFHWFFLKILSIWFYVSWKLRKTVLLKKIAPEFFQKPEFFRGPEFSKCTKKSLYS